MAPSQQKCSLEKVAGSPVGGVQAKAQAELKRHLQQAPQAVPERFTAVFKDEGKLGMAMHEAEDGSTVLDEPSGQAAVLGLQTGDVIVAVQGDPALQQPPEVIRQMVVDAGRPLTVEVLRG